MFLLCVAFMETKIHMALVYMLLSYSSVKIVAGLKPAENWYVGLNRASSLSRRPHFHLILTFNTYLDKDNVSLM